MKKVKKGFGAVYNPVYKNWAYVMAAWPAARVEKWLNKGREQSERFLVPSSCEGAHWGLGPYGNAIWITEWCGGCPRCLSVLAHETLHLSIKILYDRGVGIELPKAEELTYLHEFYMREFLTKLGGKSCS